eukprot:353320-Chlamydomonas_euryale.AAC.3
MVQLKVQMVGEKRNGTWFQGRQHNLLAMFLLNVLSSFRLEAPPRSCVRRFRPRPTVTDANPGWTGHWLGFLASDTLSHPPRCHLGPMLPDALRGYTPHESTLHGAPPQVTVVTIAQAKPRGLIVQSSSC